MNKLIVSFDFDSTLDKPIVQKYAKFLVDSGIEVHIVTSRFDAIHKYTEKFKKHYGITDIVKQHKYLYEVADEIGIPEKNIHYTNMLPKYFFFQDHPEFLWHLDDDEIELEDINRYTKTKGISVFSNWERKCNKLIDIWKFNNIK